MPDSTLQEAIKEAYASAPSDVIILHTLEFRHPSFKDDDGNTTAIRVVRDFVNLRAFLEDEAPLNAAEEVEFVAMAFELNLPNIDTTPIPEISITLDNVSREIIKHIDGAASSQDKIEVTYRPYLSSDLSAPQMIPPITLTITEITADIMQINATARMMDIGNKSFPSETYTLARFVGLTN